MINLPEYLSGAIGRIVDNAFSAASKNYSELFYLYKFRKYSNKAKAIRQGYEDKGIHIPPFLIASITSSCNLHCHGCYARANSTCGSVNHNQLSTEQYHKIFSEARALGINFILLAGGEPLIRKDVILVAKDYREIMFPIFTNGTMIDEQYIKLFNSNRNLLPIISLEGDRASTDARRGEGIYNQLMSVIEQLENKNIFYGLSITTDKNNLNEVIDEEFIGGLYKRGCKVIFYIEYVPVDRQTEHLAPDNADRLILEEGINRLADTFKNMIILSFPGDEKHLEGCLAAGRGFFHISVDGAAEPCPFSPFSDTNLKDKRLLEALSSPLFVALNASGLLKEEHNGGCLLHQKEEEVRRIIGDKK